MPETETPAITPVETSPDSTPTMDAPSGSTDNSGASVRRMSLASELAAEAGHGSDALGDAASGEASERSLNDDEVDAAAIDDKPGDAPAAQAEASDQALPDTHPRIQELTAKVAEMERERVATERLRQYQAPIEHFLSTLPPGTDPAILLAEMQAQDARFEDEQLQAKVDAAITAQKAKIEEAGGWMDESTENLLRQTQMEAQKAQLLVQRAEQREQVAKQQEAVNKQRETGEVEFGRVVAAFKGNEDMIPESIHAGIKQALVTAAPQHQAVLGQFLEGMIRDIGNSVRAKYGDKKAADAAVALPKPAGNGAARMASDEPQDRAGILRDLKNNTIGRLYQRGS